MTICVDGQGTLTIVRWLRKFPPVFLGRVKELAFVPRESYHLIGLGFF